MEREIIFRAKAVNTEMWVYGDLVHNQKVTKEGLEPRVMVGGYEVYKDTIGQYTGLKDKNGKDIYEGDILRTDLERDYLIVVFRNGAFMFDCFDEKHYYDFMTYAEDDSGIINLSIIGNIYDNKELLKGELK